MQINDQESLKESADQLEEVSSDITGDMYTLLAIAKIDWWNEFILKNFNFKIATKGVGYVADKKSLEEFPKNFVKVAEEHKKNIITDILKDLKSGLNYNYVDFHSSTAEKRLLTRCKTLLKYIDWPEINTIVKSMETQPGNDTHLTESELISRGDYDDLYNIWWCSGCFSGFGEDSFSEWISQFNDSENFTSQIKNFLEESKKKIIWTLLDTIKVKRYCQISNVIETLKKFVTWPELDVIKKSVDLELGGRSALLGESDENWIEGIPRDIYADLFDIWAITSGMSFYNWKATVVKIHSTEIKDLPDRIREIFNNNKDLIIKKMLKRVKEEYSGENGYIYSDIGLFRYFKLFKKYNITWPEIDIIKKSVTKEGYGSLSESKLSESDDPMVKVDKKTIRIIDDIRGWISDTPPLPLPWFKSQFGIEYKNYHYFMRKKSYAQLPTAIKQTLEYSKKNIITKILSTLKNEMSDDNYWDGSNISDDIIYYIGVFKKYVNWPELDIIEKSLIKQRYPDQIEESVDAKSLSWELPEWGLNLLSIITAINGMGWYSFENEKWLEDEFGKNNISESDENFNEFNDDDNADYTGFVPVPARVFSALGMTRYLEHRMAMNTNNMSYKDWAFKTFGIRRLDPKKLIQHMSVEDVRKFPERFMAYLDEHKKEILTVILKRIKNGYLNFATEKVSELLEWNVDWPELRVITKSLVKHNVSESKDWEDALCNITPQKTNLPPVRPVPKLVKLKSDIFDIRLIYLIVTGQAAGFNYSRFIEWMKQELGIYQIDDEFLIASEKKLLKPRVAAILDDHKKKIISTMLKSLKDDLNYSRTQIPSEIKLLSNFVDWPELDIIEKSLRMKPENVNESFSPKNVPKDLWIDVYNVARVVVGKDGAPFDPTGSDLDLFFKENFGIEFFNHIPEISQENLDKLPERLKQVTNDNKKLIITRLLNSIKNFMDENSIHTTELVVTRLMSIVNWPELDIIMKSLTTTTKPGKIQESSDKLIKINNIDNVIYELGSIFSLHAWHNSQNSSNLINDYVTWFKKYGIIVKTKMYRGSRHYSYSTKYKSTAELLEKISQTLNSDKKQIITNLLLRIKDEKFFNVDSLLRLIEILEFYTSEPWPELEIIKKSLKQDSLTESAGEEDEIILCDLRDLYNLLIRVVSNGNGRLIGLSYRDWLKDQFGIKTVKELHSYDSYVLPDVKQVRNKVAEVLKENKKNLIVKLLNWFKADSFNCGNIIISYIRIIEKYVNWPELDIIKKSLEQNPLNESDEEEEIDLETMTHLRLDLRDLFNLCTGGPISDYRDWLENQFGIKTTDEDYPRRIIWHISSLNQVRNKVAEVLKENKKNIIVKLLEWVKATTAGYEYSQIILNYIKTIEKYVKWPELVVIKKSIKKDQKMNKLNELNESASNEIKIDSGGKIIQDLQVIYRLTERYDEYDVDWRDWIEQFDITRSIRLQYTIKKSSKKLITEKMSAKLDNYKTRIITQMLKNLRDYAAGKNDFRYQMLEDIEIIKRYVKWPELKIINDSIIKDHRSKVDMWND